LTGLATSPSVFAALEAKWLARLQEAVISPRAGVYVTSHLKRSQLASNAEIGMLETRKG
jgi:hypothetical protein